MLRLCSTLKAANGTRGRERMRIGGKDLVAVRVMGVRAGCCQERLTENTGIIVDMGVIFFPQCSRAPSECILEGLKVLTGLRRNTRR